MPPAQAWDTHRIGTVLPDGELYAGFDADFKSRLSVDHIMGCNMSFRREVIGRLGGFREDYPGISGVCEDTDMCLRVKALGYKIVLEPAACVDHLGAPQVKGRRFDARYCFYGAQNNVVLMMRHRKLFPRAGRRFVVRMIGERTRNAVRAIGGELVRWMAFLAGLFCGIIRGTILLVARGTDPIRRDAEAQRISQFMLGDKAVEDGGDVTNVRSTSPASNAASLS